METWWFDPNGFAEQHDHTKLIWIDAEGEGEEGYNGRDCQGDQEQERPRETSTAGHHMLELVVAVRTQRGATVAFTAAIAPRHDLVLSMCELSATGTLSNLH